MLSQEQLSKVRDKTLFCTNESIDEKNFTDCLCCVFLKFEKDGYLVLENLISVDQCDQLKNEMNEIIKCNHFVDECKSLPKFNSQVSPPSVFSMFENIV